MKCLLQVGGGSVVGVKKRGNARTEKIISSQLSLSQFCFCKLKTVGVAVPILYYNGAAEPTRCCKVFFSHANVSSDHLDGLAVANRQHRYS